MDLVKEVKETVIYIMVGLVAAFIINTGLGYALSTEKPIMAVVSDSMEPTFYKGDLVVVKGVETDDIQVGDIIVFHNPYRNIPVVHRVIKIQRTGSMTYFYTKGDNNRTNPHSDQTSGIAPPIPEDLVKGRVVKTIPKLGWFRVAVTGLF
jgi:signal peptidase